MEVSTTRVNRGQCMQLVFSIAVQDDNNREKTISSNIEDIDGIAMLRLDFTICNPNIKSNISYKRHESLKHENVEVTIKDRDQTFQVNCNNDWTAIKLGDRKRSTVLKGGYCSYDCSLYVLKISISANIVNKPTFQLLYDDNDFTDFKIGTDNTVVSVHRSVLSATSVVFHAMLDEEWKGTNEGFLDVKGVTQVTLETFKKYMYYGALPEDSDLRLLLLIGRRYKILALESLCVYRLAQNVKSEGLMDLLEFAVDNKLPELLFKVLQVTPKSVVKTAFEGKNESDTKVREVVEKTSMMKLT